MTFDFNVTSLYMSFPLRVNVAVYVPGSMSLKSTSYLLLVVPFLTLIVFFSLFKVISHGLFKSDLHDEKSSVKRTLKSSDVYFLLKILFAFLTSNFAVSYVLSARLMIFMVYIPALGSSSFSNS